MATNNTSFLNAPFCASKLWGNDNPFRDDFKRWMASLDDAELAHQARVYTRHDRRHATGFSLEFSNRRERAVIAARIERNECENGCDNGWIRWSGSDYPCGACNS